MKKTLSLIMLTIVTYVLTISYSYAGVTFTDVSEVAGISQISPTWGVSWGDVNADGWEDVYLNNHQYWPGIPVLLPPALFLNLKNGQFQNVNTSYGLIYEGDQHGAVWGDFNNDGYPDLFQSRGSNQGQNPSSNFLYRNSGQGSFTDIASQAGVDVPVARGRGGCWFDYNKDGFLDLYFNTIVVGSTQGTLFRNRGDETFEDIGSLAGVVSGSSRGCTPLDYNNDGLIDLFVLSRPFKLFKNKGDGTYQDVTSMSFPSDKVVSMGYAWGDYDNDGDMDLYIASSNHLDGFEATNQKIASLSNLQFGEVKGVEFEVSNGQTINFDLYDYVWRQHKNKIYLGQNKVNPQSNPFVLQVNDPIAAGNPNFIPGEKTATYIWHEGGRWYIRGTTLSNDPNEAFDAVITTDGQFINTIPFNISSPNSVVPSRLYENRGDGTFRDVAPAAGVSGVFGGQAAQWLDVDNDGDMDLYVVETGELYNAPNKLFINNGDKTFTDMATASGAEANVQGRGENTAYGDYNDDGFLDLFITNGLGPAPFSYGRHVLLSNNGNMNHWLKIKLTGTFSNRDAVGSLVSITVGGRKQVRQQMGGTTNYAQSSSVIHFGLGMDQIVNEVRVTWPSGVTQTILNVSADQTLLLKEPEVLVTHVPLTTVVSPSGTLKFKVTFKNLTPHSLTVDYWGYYILPNGARYPKGKEAIGPFSTNLLPNDSITKTILYDIPLPTPSGSYTYKGFVGYYPSVSDQSEFNLQVLP